MIENGYLILADISGYTQFLNESELEHAQEIITSLINAILKPIHPPMILHRVEGDAVFAYTTKNAFLRGQSLLESLENLYYAFAYELESNDRNTTCTCRACQNMKTLDLKMVVHYGEFGLQSLASQTELIGRDVNTAHRLLKNSIVEATGAKSYLFITEAAAAEMMLGEFIETLVPHAETYADAGEVRGYVYDLDPAWQRERVRHRVFISSQEALASVEFDLPVAPPVAWDYLNEPECRAMYRGYDNLPVVGTQQGRLGIGTTYHCAHGDKHNPETILDWKPFEYVTFRGTSKMLDFTGIIDFTVSLKPTEAGTRVSVNYLKPRGEPPTLLSKIVGSLFGIFFKSVMPRYGKQWSNAITEMIQEDQAAGKIKLEVAPVPT